MFHLIPNDDYESQSASCKRALCEQDFREICNLLQLKKRLRKSMGGGMIMAKMENKIEATDGMPFCDNDDVFCKCRTCEENQMNGGTCSHCFTCIEGSNAMDVCAAKVEEGGN